MSKKKKGNNKKENRKDKDSFKFNDDVKEFIKCNFDKFKKKNNFYDSKKDAKKGYYDYLISLLPETINTLVRYGYREEVAAAKDDIYKKFDDDFLKRLQKRLDKGYEIENIEFFPIIVRDIICITDKFIKEQQAQGVDVVAGIDNIIDISKFILEKKIKKLTEAGIPENTAFDLLSVIPNNKLLDKSPYYNIRIMFAVLYEHGKTVTFTPNQIKLIFKTLVGKKRLRMIVSFSLLEKKERLSSFNDSQKALFNLITEWTFKTLENMEKDDIKDILTSYINVRKKDLDKGKDSNRRYYISSLPKEDYPSIMKVVDKLIKDENNKKFL